MRFEYAELTLGGRVCGASLWTTLFERYHRDIAVAVATSAAERPGVRYVVLVEVLP